MDPRSARGSGDSEVRCVFSIIVPMRNEELHIEETLNSLIAQDYPAERVEILVVDARSTDASRDIVGRLAAHHPHIRLLDNPRLVSAAARNIGIKTARGQIVGIVDSHSYVQPDFLRTAERLFAETGADCLGRPVELFIAGDSYVQRVIGAARTSWLGHNVVSPRYGSARGTTSPLSVGILYRREVFDRIGLFDESFQACEDVELNWRLQQAGLASWTDPALTVYYHPRSSLWRLFKQMARYAYWRYRLLRSRRRAFHASQAAPAAAAAVGLISIVGALAGWWWSAIPLALAAGYAAVNITASVRASLRRGFRYLPLLPVAYAAIHFGVAAGFWGGALDEARRTIARVWAASGGRGRESNGA
jgi:succinoglycan biosynthesis protein ExoA